MGTCCSVPDVEEANSAQQFRMTDANNNNLVCQKEMGDFVSSKPEMWAMLSVNLNLEEDVCRATATRVAMELATGLRGQAALDTEMTEAQFHSFRTKYIVDGKGSQEFFHRCVFASFDKENNGTLDGQELDQFLDIFYKTGSIFQGDSRLPPREELKGRITSACAKNNGTVSFEEIRKVIGGNTGSTSFVPDMPPTATTNAPPSSQPTSQVPQMESAPPEETPEVALPPKTSTSEADEPEQTPESSAKSSPTQSNKNKTSRQTRRGGRKKQAGKMTGNGENINPNSEELSAESEPPPSPVPGQKKRRKSKDPATLNASSAELMAMEPTADNDNKPTTTRRKKPPRRANSTDSGHFRQHRSKSRSASPSGRQARRASASDSNGNGGAAAGRRRAGNGRSKSPSARKTTRTANSGNNKNRSVSPSSRKPRNNNKQGRNRSPKPAAPEQ